MSTLKSASAVQVLSVRKPRWNLYLNKLIAKEASSFLKYYDSVTQWKIRKEDSGLLLNGIDCGKKNIIKNDEAFPSLSKNFHDRHAVLINGSINHDFDIQGMLLELKSKLSRSSRVVLVAYNPYLSIFYRLANLLGVRKGEIPSTFITQTDLANTSRLAGFEVVRSRPVGYSPWKLFGLGSLINTVLPCIPVLRWFAWTNVVILKPTEVSTEQKPSLTVVIPARNEKGNIENALKRLPTMEAKLEVIFVEGHSNDGTWEEILRVKEIYKADPRFTIQAFRQQGKGKSDAVRLGFANANCDLLTILDADLTMPPELLMRFYDAYCEGHADFINGTRLVYPMEGDAMRFLNRLGNIFFAKALSYVLDSKLGDSLCGTKLLSRSDYARFISWRKDFGDFDPFGDFELLFPAAILGLGIIDIPIRYRARTYGSTNISRFRHGFMLLKMTLIGLFRVKTG